MADTDAGVCGGLVPTLNGCCSFGYSPLVIEWTDGGRPILSLPAPAARLLAGVFGVLGVCSGEGCGKTAANRYLESFFKPNMQVNSIQKSIVCNKRPWNILCYPLGIFSARNDRDMNEGYFMECF